MENARMQGFRNPSPVARQGGKEIVQKVIEKAPGQRPVARVMGNQ